MTGADDAIQRAAQAKLIQNPTNMQLAFDPQGLQASMARGNNVYMGGLPYAPGAGRPRNPNLQFGDMSNPAMQQALQMKMQQYGQEAQQRTMQNRGQVNGNLNQP